MNKEKHEKQLPIIINIIIIIFKHVITVTTMLLMEEIKMTPLSIVWFILLFTAFSSAAKSRGKQDSGVSQNSFTIFNVISYLNTYKQ